MKLFNHHERQGNLTKRRAFFLGKLKRVDQAHPVDQPVRHFGRDNLITQTVFGNCARMIGLHRGGESCGKFIRNDAVG